MKVVCLFLSAVAIALTGILCAAEPADITAGTTPAPDITRARMEELSLAAGDLTTTERHHLGPLSSHELRTLAESIPGQPPRVGLVRHLSRPLELRALSSLPVEGSALSAGGGLLRRASDGSLTWTLSVSSTGAHAMRLHFDRFLLPDGARAFVYSTVGEAHGPYTNALVRSIVADGRDFWTNSVYSSTLLLEVQFPGATSPLDLSIDAAAHIELPPASADARLDAEPEGTECFVDVACAQENATLLDSLSRAAAQLTFARSGSFYLCTGSLVNVSKTTELEPYLLTANHCFSNQTSASSLEALWDYRGSVCGGSPPSPATLPRNLGSTLLMTSSTSDFTFVRLAQPPPGTRSFLGWNADSSAIGDGTTIYRVANPQGGPQRFSRHVLTSISIAEVCSGLPQSSFLYSRTTYGGTTGGSSGSPMTNSATQILGQLFGKCGSDTSDPCNYTVQSTVDGAFAVTYPFIAEWLDPSGGTEPCTPSSTTICVQSNRFRITLSARDPRTGRTDTGYVMSSTNLFGYFAFPVLAGNQTDPQVFVKVLDGRPINNKWWVFYASLTDVEFTLTVVDTQTGARKDYYQAPYTQQSANDTSAFE